MLFLIRESHKCTHTNTKYTTEQKSGIIAVNNCKVYRDNKSTTKERKEFKTLDNNILESYW